MAITNPLLFFDETPGPIEVEILNPRSVVRLGVLSEGDNHFGIGFYQGQDATAARQFASALADTMDSPAFVMADGKLTITLPEVPEPNRYDGGIELFVPARSTVTYRSDSGTLDFQANLDPRNNWRKRAVDEPPPPLDLTYRAENGEATIVGASGTVDASDRDGVIYIRPDGGVATAVTSTGTVRASGTGVLRLRGEERGSRVLLSPPCDLDLTVDPGEGVAQFGLTFDTGDRLDGGTYHAKAKRPPLDSMYMVPPSLTVTRVSPSPRDASQTASAVLTGASEQVRTPLSDKQRPPAGDVARAKPTQLKRGEGNTI